MIDHLIIFQYLSLNLYKLVYYLGEYEKPEDIKISIKMNPHTT